jgi:hypothetical protein
MLLCHHCVQFLQDRSEATAPSPSSRTRCTRFLEPEQKCEIVAKNRRLAGNLFPASLRTQVVTWVNEPWLVLLLRIFVGSEPAVSSKWSVCDQVDMILVPAYRRATVYARLEPLQDRANDWKEKRNRNKTFNFSVWLSLQQVWALRRTGWQFNNLYLTKVMWIFLKSVHIDKF